MKKKLLLSNERTQLMAKDIAVFEDPERLKSVLNKLSWKILQLISEKEMYPMRSPRNLVYISRRFTITSEYWRGQAQ